MIRKVHWIPHHDGNSYKFESFFIITLLDIPARICSLDIDPEGTRIATIDEYEYLSISKLDIPYKIFYSKSIGSDSSIFQKINLSESNYCKAAANRCRWNPIASIPEIAIKIEKHKLNFLDVNKTDFVYKNFLFLDRTSYCNYQLLQESYYCGLIDPCWIEWNREGKLVVCGCGKSTFVCDRRVGEVVRNFEDNSTSTFSQSMRD